MTTCYDHCLENISNLFSAVVEDIKVKKLAIKIGYFIRIEQKSMCFKRSLKEREKQKIVHHFRVNSKTNKHFKSKIVVQNSPLKKYQW